MWYLFEVYGDDHQSIQSVLQKLRHQFENLERLIHEYLASQDFTRLAALCHKMSNSAMLLGANELKARFIEMEDYLSGDTLSVQEIKKRSQSILELLPQTLNIISTYLQYFD